MASELAAAYVARACAPYSSLAKVCGISNASLDRLDALGVVPEPTYRIYADGVASAIGKVRVTHGGASDAYFGPAVVSWLRRAALFSEGDAPADLVGALKA